MNILFYISQIVVSLVLAFFSLLSLPTAPEFIFPLIGISGCLVFIFSLRSSSSGILILFICFFPILGHTVAQFFLSCFLLGRKYSLRPFLTTNESIAGSLIAGLVIGSTYLGIDNSVIGVGLTEMLSMDFSQIRDIVAWNSEPWVSILTQALYYLALLFYYKELRIIFSANDEFEKNQKNLSRSLIAGIAICLFIGIAQLTSLHPIFHRSLGVYWLAQGRISAGFSDPNSFGIMTLLLAPLLVVFSKSNRNKFCIFLMPLLLLLALFSGSRTLILGCGLWCLAFFFQNKDDFHIGKYLKFKNLGIMLLGLIIFVIAIFYSHGASTPFSRIATMLSEGGVEGFFSSRILFARLALGMWERYPFLGAGLGRFIPEQGSIALDMEIELGTWRDNANNFYLQVLSETGLWGFLCLFAAILLLRNSWHKSKTITERIARISTLIFGVLLLTGPHIFFGEVGIVFALTMAFAQGNLKGHTKGIPILSFLIFAIPWVIPSLVNKKYKPSGVYDLEKSESGLFRWTSKKAVIPICLNSSNNNKGEGYLKVRSAVPPPFNKPQTVFLEGSKSKKIILKDNNWKEVALLDSAKYVVFEVENTWKPKDLGISNDRRKLGIQVLWSENICREMTK